jgi:hypothetical protein
MNDGLKDVLAAASRAPGAGSADVATTTPAANGRQARPPTSTAGQRSEVVALIAAPVHVPLPPPTPAPSLRAVPPAPAPTPAPAKASSQALNTPQIGPLGLRLGFWLSGFHEALQARLDAGETIAEREASLLDLSKREFAGMRPMVIAMAVQRLHSVLGSNGNDVDGGSNQETMEQFAHCTLTDLSRRASALLETDGPDAAFSLLGGDASTIDPLAIFQIVFTTALNLADSFASMVGEGSGSLRRTAHALETEIEKV